MIRRVKLVHNLSAKIYNLPAAQRTIKHFQDHALLKAAEHTAISRKAVVKNVHATIPKGNI